MNPLRSQTVTFFATVDVFCPRKHWDFGRERSCSPFQNYTRQPWCKYYPWQTDKRRLLRCNETYIFYCSDPTERDFRVETKIAISKSLLGPWARVVFKVVELDPAPCPPFRNINNNDIVSTVRLRSREKIRSYLLYYYDALCTTNKTKLNLNIWTERWNVRDKVFFFTKVNLKYIVDIKAF